MLEKLLSLPGFIYQIEKEYYFLGKWICKKCTEKDASDCVAMYEMCRDASEESDAALYFNKMRAYSDFALDIPYNPGKIQADMDALISVLSDSASARLQEQIAHFEEDYPKYS